MSNEVKDSQPIESPVNMYILFARFFAITAKQLEKEFGQKGLDVLAECVKTFGIERGKNIARRAAQAGKKNTLENYLDSYDMERSELFGYKNDINSERVNQVFNRCIFASTWIDDKDEKYGRIYCEHIDPSIAKGYNKNMMCEHNHIMYDNNECTFQFYMKDNKDDN